MISIFEIFKISVGPSSSHTLGPMLIANDFIKLLEKEKLLKKVDNIKTTFYGSLAHTGIGHATDRAVKIGLLGFNAINFDQEKIEKLLLEIDTDKKIYLNQKYKINFDDEKDFIWNKDYGEIEHPNTMDLVAFSKGKEIFKNTYYSIGGGFFNSKLDKAELKGVKSKNKFPFDFHSASELLEICKTHSLRIDELVLNNELSLLHIDEVHRLLDQIWDVMKKSIENGITNNGQLPGWLKVQRRAPIFYQKITSNHGDNSNERLMDWLNLYAMAVNEENAVGGRVITAPTNGAAGIIPSVIKFYCTENGKDNKENIYRFLLTAGAIGSLYKERASISGAEMGCQGEVGVACSMAAAGLCAIWNGSNYQIENAAEIAMEHNLGLTCDPVGGLVQIPCIERNAIGAVKAVNAARLALQSDGTHFVTLDSVIETMRQTGMDMSEKYKETSKGGLAVNVVEC